jgi:plasmid maintenance system antidote protein VapI
MDRTQYRHLLLKHRVIRDRRFNVSAFCKRLGISRTHFYDVINGSAAVSERMVKRVAEELGISPETVIPDKKICQQ